MRPVASCLAVTLLAFCSACGIANDDDVEIHAAPNAGAPNPGDTTSPLASELTSTAAESSTTTSVPLGSSTTTSTRRDGDNVAIPATGSGPSLLGQLVFTSGRGISVMNPDGSNVRALTTTSGDFGNAFGADLSPDGRRIVFVRQVGGATLQLEVMDANGGNVVTLTPPGIYLAPRWSPDGTRILYIPGTYGVSSHDLFTMRPDGSDVQKLFSGGSRVPLSTASWSPDGSSVVVDTDDSNPDAKGLWVIDLSTGSARRIFPGEARSPAWSFGGDRIAFNSGSDIFSIRPDGSGLIGLTASPPLSAGGSLNVQPAWSPDDSQIAFVRVEAPKVTYEIFLMEADGSSLRKLTNNPAGGQGPTF